MLPKVKKIHLLLKKKNSRKYSNKLQNPQKYIGGFFYALRFYNSIANGSCFLHSPNSHELKITPFIKTISLLPPSKPDKALQFSPSEAHSATY